MPSNKGSFWYYIPKVAKRWGLALRPSFKFNE